MSNSRLPNIGAARHFMISAGFVLLSCWCPVGTASEPEGPENPIRVADVKSGHVHPSLCRTKSGTLLAVFNVEGGGGKELLSCRSTDGGRTWSEPAAVPGICDCSIYPGSLTVLRDGRVLLNWSCYRPDYRPGVKSVVDREPQFSISEDEGKTWSAPRTYPLENRTLYTCLRNPVVELPNGQWLLPFYDRTVAYDPVSRKLSPFGDRRNHGMVPIVQTPRGTLISGTPDADSPIPGGRVRNPVGGLRSTDNGRTWQAMRALPRLGVAGYDLIVLNDGGIVLTAIEYGGEEDGEIAYQLIFSRDDGRTWDTEKAITIFAPGRRIKGRGWPRTVAVDNDTLGTLFFDLTPDQPGGPGLFFIRTKLAMK